jgi:broad specificity phosphatase PhoE
VAPREDTLGRASDGGAAGTALIYLVRHGRTALNAAGALRGHIDVPLDNVGRREAVALAAALAGRGLQTVASSPLRRALETADAISARAGLVTSQDERLADRGYGEWAGVSVEEVVARWGTLDAAPGVEPMTEVRGRALRALADIGHRARGTAAVAVSHDAVIRAALTAMDLALGDPEGLAQETGCFNTVEYLAAADGSVTWRVLRVNELPPHSDEEEPCPSQ